MFRSGSVRLAAVVALVMLAAIASPAQMEQKPLTDANIGAIVVTANQIDIDYGNLALQKSKNPQVREFAQRMITDHSAVQKSVFELAAKLGLKPEGNFISEGLKKNAEEVKAKLKSLKGEEFDRLYIENEVAYHKQVTDAVQGALIPGASNPELKAALIGAQPLFLKHLEHARTINAAVNGGDGMDSMHAMAGGMQSSK